MKKNLNTREANIRTLVAAVLILGVFFFVENPYVQIICALISAVLAGTAFLRTCPIYHYMGKNTCEDVQVLATTQADQSPTTPATPPIESTPHEESVDRASDDAKPHEPVA